MGQRSAHETVGAIILAFMRDHTWTQAALASAVGISTPAVKKRLEELEAAGMPLERQEDHPHVYWSVPRGWFPEGVYLPKEDIPALLRLLARLPRGRDRNRLLEAAARALGGHGAAKLTDVVGPRELSPTEDAHLATVEDAAREGVSLCMTYYTASRGDLARRHVSVHRVDFGPPSRFVATCHRAGTLKLFRVDGITSAHLDSGEPFRASTPEAIAEFSGRTIDGFHGDGPAERLVFFVREPESRWVKTNLRPGMRAESAPNGIRVIVETPALLQVARFVVGLGAAAKPETPALAHAVLDLARGALDAVQ